jgi:hypothetical protein
MPQLLLTLSESDLSTVLLFPKRKKEPVPMHAQISKTNHSGNDVFRMFMIKRFVLLFASVKQKSIRPKP